MTVADSPPAPASHTGAARHTSGGVATWLFAASDLVVGAAVIFGVWRALPARWWPVDVLGSAVGLALLLAGALLIGGPARRLRVAGRSLRAAHLAAITIGGVLLVGAGVVSALALAAGHIVGLYGPVGGGGAIILGVVFLLLVPYLVAFPALQLRWLLTRTVDAPAVASPNDE